MQKFYVNLCNIEDAKAFVNEVSKLMGDADLTSGRFVIDAKSIMGIFSMDLSRNIMFTYHGDEDISELRNRFEAK